MEVCGQLHTPATLHAGKEPWYPLDKRLVWARESVWRRWRREKFPPSVGSWTSGGWMDHIACLDAVVMRKFPAPAGTRTPYLTARSPALYHRTTRVYPKVSGLAAWSENCKWYSSATRCSCIAILWVSLVSFAAITLCVAFQRVLIVSIYFVMTQSGNFWILLYCL
jgi:hypothetical protein